MPGSSSRRLALGGLAALVLACAACSGGRADGTDLLGLYPASADPAASPTSVAATPPATPSVSASATPGPPLPQLHSLLMTPPAGSSPWSNAWQQNPYPTGQEFVDQFYRPTFQQNELAELSAEGLVGIAQTAWITADGKDQADVLLFQFGSDAGAENRYQLASMAQANEPDTVPVTVAEPHETVLLHQEAVDDEGNVRSFVYSDGGDVVMEMFAYSQGHFDAATIERWAGAQIARLPT